MGKANQSTKDDLVSTLEQIGEMAEDRSIPS